MDEHSVSPEERKSFLQVIRRNGEQLQSVLNDILDLSKIEAGELKTEYLNVDPCQIVEDVCTLLKLKAEENGFELNWMCDEVREQSKFFRGGSAAGRRW